ncbi:GtrA family protein [Fodinicola feengrottensis]|uniref:GtrA/DPMS transmembrane domain-containing protein n=1 Tax=Fodinicola feengrottensis TaxID=435914 RepID=A0ABN2G5Z6_9ACTN|nr:GtrA family protein [Fodinicola feengrottensis]
MTGGLLAQLRRVGISRELAVFVVIGVLSTAAHLALYALLRSVLPALVANVPAVLAVMVVNTAANRRFAFGYRGSERAVRHHLEGGITFLLGPATSTLGLWLLQLLAPHATRLAELAVLAACTALSTLLRFLLLRGWVFHPRRNLSVPPTTVREPAR